MKQIAKKTEVVVVKIRLGSSERAALRSALSR